jgi:hypothetical protein
MVDELQISLGQFGNKVKQFVAIGLPCLLANEF